MLANQRDARRRVERDEHEEDHRRHRLRRVVDEHVDEGFRLVFCVSSSGT